MIYLASLCTHSYPGVREQRSEPPAIRRPALSVPASRRIPPSYTATRWCIWLPVE